MHTTSDLGTQTDRCTSSERLWLEVPFGDREAVKLNGARWDVERRQWYAPAGTDLSDLRRWLPMARIYLNCSFEAKDAVKACGGRWDAQAGKWYITDDMPQREFMAWLPGGQRTRLVLLE